MLMHQLSTNRLHGPLSGSGSHRTLALAHGLQALGMRTPLRSSMPSITENMSWNGGRSSQSGRTQISNSVDGLAVDGTALIWRGSEVVGHGVRSWFIFGSRFGPNRSITVDIQSHIGECMTILGLIHRPSEIRSFARLHFCFQFDGT